MVVLPFSLVFGWTLSVEHAAFVVKVEMKSEAAFSPEKVITFMRDYTVLLGTKQQYTKLLALLKTSNCCIFDLSSSFLRDCFVSLPVRYIFLFRLLTHSLNICPKHHCSFLSYTFHILVGWISPLFENKYLTP
jgi:hypothetical protein